MGKIVKVRCVCFIYTYLLLKHVSSIISEHYSYLHRNYESKYFSGPIVVYPRSVRFHTVFTVHQSSPDLRI